MKKNILLFFEALLCSLLLFAGSTFAQETTAAISGIVKDKSGPLAGVTITAIHVPTGTQYSISSRTDGRYNFPNVKIGGPYKLTANFIGYKQHVIDAFTLTLGQNFEANINMSEANVELKEIIVTAGQNKTFNANHTGASDIITRSQIERMPTISRSLNDFTKLTPFAGGGGSFGGRNNLNNNITVNGASFNNTFGLSGSIGGQTGAQPISIDAIDQIQVNLAPYDVRQGSFTGAGINTVTKSGSNSVTGSAYGYVQGAGIKGLKSGNVTLTKQPFDYHLAGFSFGAPLIKNKLFVFFDAEQERRSTPATTLLANRPGLTGSNVSHANASTLDSLQSFLKTKYNYNSGPYENYANHFAADRITTRFDYNINNRNTLNVNFFYLKSNKDVSASNSGAPNGNRQPSLTGLPFFSSGYNIANNLFSGIIELNSSFNNSASNKFQVGYTAMRDQRKSLGSGTFPLVDILNGQGQSLTAFGYEPFTAFNKLKTDIFQLNDYFTLFKGNHEITLGTQNQFQSYTNGFAPNYYGSYTFNSVPDFYASANNGVDNATNYTLRYSALSNDFPYGKIKNYQLGFFIQDKWKLRENFTLTYGLRLDIPIYEQTFTNNPAVPALIFRNGIQVSTAQTPKTPLLLSPRIGFNWDIKGDQTLQLRGGTGIFTGPPPQVWISNQASNNGVQFGSFSHGPLQGNVFSPDVNTYRPAPSANNLPTGYNLAITDKNFKFPQVWRSDLAIDYKLPFNIVATAEAFLTKDINAVYVQNINLPTTGTALNGPDTRTQYIKSRIYDGTSMVNGKSVYGPTLANPNITDAELMTNTNKGYSYAASIKLERNVKGLYTTLIYTHSDARSVNDGGSIAQSVWSQRPVSGDPNANVTSFSQYRLPNRVLGIISYRREYAKFMATSVGMTYEFITGGGSSYTYSGDINGDGVPYNDLIYVPRDFSEMNFVDVIKNKVITYSKAQQAVDFNNYINQDPYLKTRRGKYAERNGLLNPYYGQTNLNLTQDFFLQGHNGKRNTLRFTADIFNFQNLVNKNWGIVKVPVTTGGLIKYAGLDAAGKPTFQMNYQDPTNKVPYTSTFYNPGTAYWTMQLGLKYIFQ